MEAKAYMTALIAYSDTCYRLYAHTGLVPTLAASLASVIVIPPASLMAYELESSSIKKSAFRLLRVNFLKAFS